MFKILDITKNNLIAFQVKGKIEKSDYDKLKALLEKNEREYDKQKLYVEIEEIEGISIDALWEDFRMFFTHNKNFDKVAIIGERNVTGTLTKLSKPFVSGEIRFYNKKETVNAQNWIRS